MKTIIKNSKLILVQRMQIVYGHFITMLELCIALFALVMCFCSFPENRYDPDDKSYVSPLMVIDTISSTVHANDTIPKLPVHISICGNDMESRFRWCLDDSTIWSAWVKKGNTPFQITYDSVGAGKHYIIIQTCYSPDGEFQSVKINFTKVNTPLINKQCDTTLQISLGENCTLWVNATGESELKYTWFKGQDEIGGVYKDTLLLQCVTLSDTGSYICKVSNSYGFINSDTIHVMLQPQNLYSITYNENKSTGGKAPVDTFHYRSGSSFTVQKKSDTLIKTGYFFHGWNSQSDGNGANYTVGQSYKIEKDLVLYANWKTVPDGMILISAKDSSFQMGSLVKTEEQPVHRVMFKYDYYMSKTEVTQGEYLSVMGMTSSVTTSTLPVDKVTWFDAVLYCNKKSKRDGLDTVYSYSGITGDTKDGCTDLPGLEIDFSKNGYRLPNEAEWEYACRAGTNYDYYWNAESALDYAWFSDNSDSVIHPVALKKPNKWGLYDMSGNVWEWCNDWYGDYTNTHQYGDKGESGLRIRRGGGHSKDKTYLRSAYRGNAVPGNRNNIGIGIRTVLPIVK